MTAYRFRKCPRCGAVFPGGHLRVLRYGEGHYHKRGDSLRCCPNCGHKGFTQDFPIVRAVNNVRGRQKSKRRGIILG